MKLKVKNRFHMLKVVHDTCTEYISIIDSIPALKAAYLRLKPLIDEMASSMQIQIVDHTGLTKEKNYLKQLLAEKTVAVASALMSYAHVNHDYSLEEEVRCSNSKLQKMADDVMLELCKSIYFKANAIVADLADYAVDATVLTALQEAYKDFEKLIPKVSEAIDTRKLHTAKLNGLLTEASDLLKNEMDRLVLLLPNANADFKQLYKNSRMIDDYRGKHSPDEVPEGYGSLSGVVSDSTDSGAIEDATVLIAELNLSSTTDEDGEYYFEQVPVGVYTLQVSAETYVNETVESVEVVAGVVISEDIGMNSEE